MGKLPMNRQAGVKAEDHDDEAVRRVACMLGEWEDGGELTTAFARRVVAVVRKIDRAPHRPI